MSSFGEVYDPFCTVCLGASFVYFSNFPNLESDFPIFQIPDPRKSVLGPGDVVAYFLSKNSSCFVQFCEFSINLV